MGNSLETLLNWCCHLIPFPYASFSFLIFFWHFIPNECSRNIFYGTVNMHINMNMNNIDKYLLAIRMCISFPPHLRFFTLHCACCTKYAIEKFTSIFMAVRKKKKMAALGGHYTVIHSDQLCGAQQVRCYSKQLLNGDRMHCLQAWLALISMLCFFYFVVSERNNLI